MFGSVLLLGKLFHLPVAESKGFHLTAIEWQIHFNDSVIPIKFGIQIGLTSANLMQNLN